MLRFRFVLLAVLLPATARGQDATDLAKQTQNPVADLATVPLQFNFNSGGDLGDGTQMVFNFQPVVPLKMTHSVNIIWRTIVPYVSQPLAGGGHASGIGDIQTQIFFTPARSGGIVWGIGPILQFPSATNDVLRTGEWAVGPTAVIVKNAGPFVLGALANQLWHFAGVDDDPKVNQFLLQPFINYNFKGGWSLAFAPIITANWSADSGDEWTVPLGIGVSKVTAIGRQPVSLSMQYYHNIERPTGSGANTLRLAWAFLFPTPQPPKPAAPATHE